MLIIKHYTSHAFCKTSSPSEPYKTEKLANPQWMSVTLYHWHAVSYKYHVLFHINQPATYKAVNLSSTLTR